MAQTAPGIYNFTLYKGRTLRKTFIWKPAGVAAALAGYTARSYWRLIKNLDGTSPLVTLTTENNGIILTPTISGNPVVGGVQLFYSDSGTLALNTAIYYYLVDLIQPNGDVIPFLEGKINVIATGVT